MVERAIDFVLRWQRRDGSITLVARRVGRSRGLRAVDRLVVDLPRLRCAIALAERAGQGAPGLGAGRAAASGTPSRTTPALLRPEARVRDGLVLPDAGRRARAATAGASAWWTGWDTFVIEGRGVRCVSTGDWVTAAETAECVLALDALGHGRRRRSAVFAAGQGLRLPDGSYWTGMVYPEEDDVPRRASAPPTPRPPWCWPPTRSARATPARRAVPRRVAARRRSTWPSRACTGLGVDCGTARLR